MYLTEALEKKWGKLLNNDQLPKITDTYRRAVTTILLENQVKALTEANAINSGGFLSEDAPANHSGDFPNNTNLKGFDPIMIALVRRAAPNLLAYDICGVQPMQGPTGLIFALRSKYSSQGGAEALFNEANTEFSAAGRSDHADLDSHTGTTPSNSNSTNYLASTGANTADAEAWGTANSSGGYPSAVPIPEMAFSIDKVTVTARTRALKAEYTIEIAQDLKAVHGLDAEAELANILSTEILAEINREIVRTIGFIATKGAQHNTTTAGTFDLNTDSNGRWSVEKFKGLMFQIEREANAVAKATRRGRGNIIITSSDVASALAMAGVLDYAPALAGNNLQVDDTGPTFAGVLNGRFKVFIDPYVPSASTDYFIVGYKGTSPYDAGLFYAPYVPLQMVRAIDQGSFQPKIGFKTRYGVVANPFATAAGDGVLAFGTNVYYRSVAVTNLM